MLSFFTNGAYLCHQMTPKNITIHDFTYDLPEERIAKYPLIERDMSKCLILHPDGKMEENTYSNLDKYIPENTLLVFNNTKVVEARLRFQKSTGSTIELFCLEPDDSFKDITQAMLAKQNVRYKCLVGGAKKWKSGPLVKEINLAEGDIILQAWMIERRNDYFIIELEWNQPKLSFAEILHFTGVIPLPPYLKRETEESDKQRYQTVYAKHDGSVAAPTAGLHFTEKLLAKMQAKNIDTDFVTLHVGAGTFKPVKADIMEDHDMHYEAIDVSISLLENLLAHKENNIISVGTTSLRTLESLYWMGVKVGTDDYDISETPEISQWEPYELPQSISKEEAINNLINWLKNNDLTRLITRTQIIIAPGYQLRIANAIVTNFHQPQSTLILLVAAVVGDKWRSLYNYALDNDFRFLSYGDGSLLWKQ